MTMKFIGTKILTNNKIDKILRKYLFSNTVASENIIKQIIENTIISIDHLTPELKLRLITSDCEIFHKPYIKNIFDHDPFWGFYWPGGQALTRFILDNPNLVRNKTCLDVGSGNGATSIAAKKVGAKYALANDIDQVACIAANINAELNDVKLKFSTRNLIGEKCKEDIIFLGDVFYDEDFAKILMRWLKELSLDNKLILIGDPGRHGLTENRLRHMIKLKSYELPNQCAIENHGFKFVNVWKFIH